MLEVISISLEPPAEEVGEFPLGGTLITALCAVLAATVGSSNLTLAMLNSASVRWPSLRILMSFSSFASTVSTADGGSVAGAVFVSAVFAVDSMVRGIVRCSNQTAVPAEAAGASCFQSREYSSPCTAL